MPSLDLLAIVEAAESLGCPDALAHLAEIERNRKSGSAFCFGKK